MNKLKGILIVALVVVFLAGLGVAVRMYVQSMMVTTPVENVFADVNGDGKMDLIVRADVVYNTDPQNLAVSQLSNP